MPTINWKKSDKNTNLKYIPQWPPVNIEFQDLSYSVPHQSGKNVILNGISGQFQSSQISAILGASGAGKSTLLNILAGFKTSKTSVNVLINGKPRCIRTFRKMSRYIMQKDLHHHHLTVHEAMMVSADLKLGNHLTKLQKNEVIQQILDLLGLTNTSQTMCEVLSGGEMKRLSIALELVDNPPVIFLDEPTTGLDDLSSSQCISLLRRIALGGRTIVCSIHIPSAKILEMFDLVYAMAGGQCVYQGSPSQIIPYLQTTGLTCPITYNPADFIVEVSCGDCGIEYIDRMVSAAENVPGEIALLKREHFNRWFKLAPYYWAFLLATAPVHIVICLTFLTVTYPMTDQPLEWTRICMFFSITIMIALVSERMGLLIASRFNLVNGLFIGPAVMFPIVLLSVCGMGDGYKFEISPFLKFLRNFSYLRFALEGLFDATYGHNRADTVCPDIEMFCLFAKADYLKSLLGFHESSYLVSIVALWSYYLLFATMAYFMIKMRLSLFTPT
ncbi:ATP-binding cassette sub-family G member 1-like isoform X4 [Bradysia coprophila]|uniref:ATP-binding cassette sub-family G member 1-like isoform X4 n=1 Tax=Bradysia coprophila TaxID=38358 RepID=UPI00187DC616|nr:ATP-binding cassette sub-family G member 1-like isoform X4 [Bradysia coprophila]